MSVFDLVLWILAAICWALAAFGRPIAGPADRLGWLGAFLVAVAVITPF